MVSKLILGTVQFGLKYGINNSQGKPEKEKVFEILSCAYKSGIRQLDTAESYGNAHELIGQFHKINPQKKFQIITKFPHNIEGSFNDKIDIYLKQLNVDYLSAVLFHSFDSYIAQKGQLRHMIKLKERGVLNFGVSVYTNEQMNEAINDISVDIIQIPFNLLDNLSLRGKLLTKAKEKNKVVHTRSTYLQGLFFMENENTSTIRAKLSKEMDLIRDISIKSSMSIGSMALNYCVRQPNIDAVLIGVDSVQQLKENILFLKNVISDHYLDQINSIKVNNIDLLNPKMWR